MLPLTDHKKRKVAVQHSTHHTKSFSSHFTGANKCSAINNNNKNVYQTEMYIKQQQKCISNRALHKISFKEINQKAPWNENPTVD
jgi:hypothetical protein